MKTIKNWKIVDVNGEACVLGNIFDHPNFPDGSHITTSTLKKIDQDKTGQTLLITTKGSVYKLVDRIPDVPREQYVNPDIKPDHYSTVDYLVSNGILKTTSNPTEAADDVGDL